MLTEALVLGRSEPLYLVVVTTLTGAGFGLVRVAESRGLGRGPVGGESRRNPSLTRFHPGFTSIDSLWGSSASYAKSCICKLTTDQDRASAPRCLRRPDGRGGGVVNGPKTTVLLEHHHKALKLPTVLREYVPVAAACGQE